jgi:hypothetical protein
MAPNVRSVPTAMVTANVTDRARGVARATAIAIKVTEAHFAMSAMTTITHHVLVVRANLSASSVTRPVRVAVLVQHRPTVPNVRLVIVGIQKRISAKMSTSANSAQASSIWTRNVYARMEPIVRTLMDIINVPCATMSVRPV